MQSRIVERSSKNAFCDIRIGLGWIVADLTILERNDKQERRASGIYLANFLIHIETINLEMSDLGVAKDAVIDDVLEALGVAVPVRDDGAVPKYRYCGVCLPLADVQLPRRSSVLGFSDFGNVSRAIGKSELLEVWIEVDSRAFPDTWPIVFHVECHRPSIGITRVKSYGWERANRIGCGNGKNRGRTEFFVCLCGISDIFIAW